MGNSPCMFVFRGLYISLRERVQDFAVENQSLRAWFYQLFFDATFFKKQQVVQRKNEWRENLQARPDGDRIFFALDTNVAKF